MIDLTTKYRDVKEGESFKPIALSQEALEIAAKRLSDDVASGMSVIGKQPTLIGVKLDVRCFVLADGHGEIES